MTIFNKDFLGKENEEGFNYPLSENKIQLLLNKKNIYEKEYNEASKCLTIHLLIGFIVFVICSHFQMEKHITLNFVTISLLPGILEGIFKRKNRTHYPWIDFMLKRNEELLKNPNVKPQIWKNMMF